MQQPAGYVNPQLPQHVCKLDKSLCGLKQSLRAWYSRLRTKLQELEFVANSSSRAVPELVRNLQQEFAVKDLGDLHYFLRVEVNRKKEGAVLLQTKYANDLLA